MNGVAGGDEESLAPQASEERHEGHQSLVIVVEAANARTPDGRERPQAALAQAGPCVGTEVRATGDEREPRPDRRPTGPRELRIDERRHLR